MNVTSSETIRIVLADAENHYHTIVSLFVWAQYRNVAEGQTDRIALASTAVCIASNVDAL